ncbi:hypothetical protein RFI_09948, partial [Reticulomyxa filosa]
MLQPFGKHRKTFELCDNVKYFSDQAVVSYSNDDIIFSVSPNCHSVKVEKTTDMHNASPFQALAPPPVPLRYAQCIAHKYEILICGSCNNSECYSYDTIKKQYKYICSYPEEIALDRHCVVKYVEENDKKNEITLLSFGGQGMERAKHTLVMKYISVWDDESVKAHSNEWHPLVDNTNKVVTIGRKVDNYKGALATIGGSNNNVLFITYYPRNISIFDLTTFEYIKHDIVPIENWLVFYCFVSKKKNELSGTNATNKKMSEMISLDSYACVCIDDFILFFGGKDRHWIDIAKEVHKYSMTENTWMQYEQTLPISLPDCVAVLIEDTIGREDGDNDNDEDENEDEELKDVVSIHICTDVNEWRKGEQRGVVDDTELIKIEEIKIQLAAMGQDLDINKLRVEFVYLLFF